MKVLLDPAPRTADEIFDPAALERLRNSYEVAEYKGDDRDAFYERHLPDTVFLLSQQPMGAERLACAARLKAIFNVETNLLPNIDYEGCFRRGIRVLAPSGVFALAVAEMALGMALSLARDIHGAHGDFLAGQERYGLAGNTRSELLTGSNIGLIGYGDIGRALGRLLAPFRPRIRVYDPWLPDTVIAGDGYEPCSLDVLLRQSRTVFTVAAITTENRHLLDAAHLALMQDGAMLLLMSRAAIADFDALRREAGRGRLRIATDVFPEEPVARGDPLRGTQDMLFSPHRAGALADVLHQIGAWTLADMNLLARGLPPVLCKRAEPETVARLRSKPIDAS